MIYQYVSVEGIPHNHYYIEEIKQFADFETPEIKEITWHSPNKEELIELCRTNNWAYQGTEEIGSWFVYKILFRI